MQERHAADQRQEILMKWREKEKAGRASETDKQNQERLKKEMER